MPERAVVWDWNGTLLDDVRAALLSMNALLERYRLPALTLKSYRETIGFPVKAFYEASGFDFSIHDWETAAAGYIDLYTVNSRDCALNPGAADAVALAASLGFRQVILSASRHDHLCGQVARHPVLAALEGPFGIADIYARSKKALVASWLERSGLSPSNVLLIGDTLHDADVARACGCRCALHTLGHQSRARLDTSGAPVYDALPDCIGDMVRREGSAPRAPRQGDDPPGPSRELSNDFIH